MKKRKNKTRRKRGGSRYFYSYNKTPITFTNVSNKQQGGFLGMGDPRYSLLPGPASDALQNLQYSATSTNNSYFGNYQGETPNWRFQPLK
jgi:hypothetical protein